MHFGPSSDQKMLVDSVSGVAADHVDLDALRGLERPGDGLEAKLREALIDLGLFGLLVPEAHGGSGLALLDAALAQEALGAACAPVATLGAMIAAPLALSLAGSPEQQAEWLPKLANGELRVGVALTEAAHGLCGQARNGFHMGNGRITGDARFVVDSAAADVFLVAADGKLHLVAAGEGISVSAAPTIDLTRHTAHLRFDDAPAETLPGDGHDQVIQALWTALAADTLGAAQTMLDRAVTYAGERVQFGRKIGSFQAVKHMCAEMAADLEPCRSLVWYAAHAAAESPDEAPLMSALAKSHLAEVGRDVARTATEVHGGMGFTDLMGLHFWFKRIGWNRQALGGPEAVRAFAAQIQGLAA